MQIYYKKLHLVITSIQVQFETKCIFLQNIQHLEPLNFPVSLSVLFGDVGTSSRIVAWKLTAVTDTG